MKTLIHLLLVLCTLASPTLVNAYPGLPVWDQSDRPWDVQLYPNPSSGRFQVKTTGQVGTVAMSVFNVIGEQVFQTSVRPIAMPEVDLSHLSKGLYVVQFRNSENGSAITRRLFLE